MYPKTNQKLRILILEDLPSDVDVICNVLKKGQIDFTNLAVDTQIKYTKALEEFAPDIVLSDHSLPSFDSYNALDILRGTGLRIPFILITATISEEFAVDILRAGADDYILKDRLERLPTAVHNALEKFRLEKEREIFLDELIKKEKYYRALVDNSADAVVTLNAKGQPTYISQSVKRVLGYTEEEIFQMDLLSISHADDIPHLAATMEKVLANPGVAIKGHTGRMLHKNGTWRWIEATLTNLLADPAVNGIVDNFRDITEKKLAQEELQTSKSNLQAIFENTSEGFILTNKEGVVKSFNSKAKELILLNNDEEIIIGKSVAGFMQDSSNETFKALMAKVLCGESLSYDNSYQRKNGETRWFNFSINPVHREGLIEGLCIAATDITHRKKIENENIIKANLLDAIGQAAIATDIKGKVSYWNKAAENIYGWTGNEAIGKNIIELTPTSVNKKEALDIIDSLKQGMIWSGEFMVQRKNGTSFPALITNSPIYNEHNKVTGIIGISTDITEKKELEKLLNKTNKLAAIGSWEIDVLNGTVYWSDITKEIREVELNYVPDLKTGISFFKEVDKEIIMEKVQQCIERGTPWDEELQISTHKGNFKWVRTIGEGEFINDKCVRIYGSFQDINARKHAELEAKRVYEERNTILESIGDAFFAADKNWIITYWNKEAEKMLRTPKDAIMGKYLWSVFADSIDSESYRKYHQAIETNQVIVFEDYYPPLERWYEISAYPADNGLSVYFKDITERKHSEIELKELNQHLHKQAKELAITNKELEDFAYVASHDLQEPLRMVTSFLSQLEKKYGDIIDEKGKTYIHFAVDGAKRMRQIILDLLEFSRVGHTLENETERLNLNELLNDILLLYRKQIEETNALIKIDELPILQGSRTPLHQVFQNLVGNALKYQEKGTAPLVEISCIEKENAWQFAIKDNGIGISKEYFEKVFVIFQRLHHNDSYAGTGMGLAICKKIIEKLGGKIWVESKDGEGSIFYFTIPKEA